MQEAGVLLVSATENIDETPSEFHRLQASTKQREAYTREREDLTAERTKLLQAHYAGAVPLELLTTEQERIAKRLAFLEARIEAGTLEYEQTQTHLDDCLALVTATRST